MFLYVILFNCKMPMHVFIPNQISPKQNLENTDIHHIGAPDDLIVYIVFHQFWVIS